MSQELQIRDKVVINTFRRYEVILNGGESVDVSYTPRQNVYGIIVGISDNNEYFVLTSLNLVIVARFTDLGQVK